MTVQRIQRDPYTANELGGPETWEAKKKGEQKPYGRPTNQGISFGSCLKVTNHQSYRWFVGFEFQRQNPTSEFDRASRCT